MPKPRWTSYSFGSSSPDEKATLRPDYMRIVSKNGKNFFVILDAKYYNIEFCAGKVKNNPGVEDVCKQHLYQIAYKRFIETHSLVPVNAFVSPLDAEGVKVIGEAEMPALTGLNNEGICPIKVVMLSANELLQHYINRQHVDLADIIALFPGA